MPEHPDPRPDSELARAYQEGDPLAAEHLFRRHAGKLAVEAHRIWATLPRATGLDFEDVFQDLSEQLLLAANRFDAARSTGHDSLLVSMKHGPYKAVEANAWRSFGIRPSETANTLSKKLWHLDRETYAKYQRLTSNQEASARLGIPVVATHADEITVDDIRNVRKFTIGMQNYGTINDLQNNGGVRFQELPTQFAILKAMAHDAPPTPEDQAIRQDNAARVRLIVEALAHYDEVGATIITKRFGLDGSLPMAHRAIGKELGKHHILIQTLEQKARRRLYRMFLDADLTPEA